MRSRTKVGGSTIISSSSSPSSSAGMGAAAAASSSILPTTTTTTRAGDGFQKKESTAAMVLTLRRQRMILGLICIVQAVIIVDAKTKVGGWISSSSSIFSSSLRSSQTTNCQIDLGQYKGPIYNSPESGTVGPPNCLLSSKWMQVSLHTVQFPGSKDQFDDWMWIDYHDRINVVVEDESSSSSRNEEEERRFLVFEQTKYALEGRTSLAIIGGIIEPGEQPEHAARREVYEEMDGLECQQFHFLGRYRTDVNRGMGWLNSFLATNCSRGRQRTATNADSNKKKRLLAAAREEEEEEEVGVADTEKQKLKSISLSEFRQAAHDGRFLEVQWTATVAQALLHPELAGGT